MTDRALRVYAEEYYISELQKQQKFRESITHAALRDKLRHLDIVIDVAELAKYLMLSGQWPNAIDAFGQAKVLHDKVKALVPDEPS